MREFKFKSLSQSQLSSVKCYQIGQFSCIHTWFFFMQVIVDCLFIMKGKGIQNKVKRCIYSKSSSIINKNMKTSYGYSWMVIRQGFILLFQ